MSNPEQTQAAQEPIEAWFSYDPEARIVTIDGIRYSRDLFQCFGATPCGTTLRIIQRGDGVITISLEIDPLAAAAPAMLAALRNVRKLISEAAMTGFSSHDGNWAERLFASQAATSAAIAKAQP